MTARFCPFCGQPIVPGGIFCPSCGANLTGATVPTGASAVPSAFVPPGMTPTFRAARPLPPLGQKTPEESRADRDALTSVGLAALFGLVGGVLGLAALFLEDGTQVFNLANSSAGTVAIPDQTALTLFGVGAVVGVILTVVELIYYRDAFKTLQQFEDRFSTPATLALVLLVTLPLVILTVLALLAVFFQASVCAGPGNPIPAGCLNGGTVLTIAAVLGVSALVAIIGYLGLLVGIWRLGTRYDAVAFKVGAVLLLIPFLNVVAAILILVTARSTRDRLSASPPSQRVG